MTDTELTAEEIQALSARLQAEEDNVNAQLERLDHRVEAMKAYATVTAGAPAASPPGLPTRQQRRAEQRRLVKLLRRSRER